METTFFGFSVRIWTYSTDPDNNVYAASSATAGIGDYFMNTTNGALFLCIQEGTNNQAWEAFTNYDTVVSLILATVLQSDWTQSSNTSQDYIKNKPTLATVATSGAYSDLSGRPSLATVATSGSYNDLSNKPTIPSAQIQSDWTQSNNALVDYIPNQYVFSFDFSSSNRNSPIR